MAMIITQVDDQLPTVAAATPDLPYDPADHAPATYRPIEGVAIPPGPAYLRTGIDTGSDLCDVRPAQALATVPARGRTPLTIAEGMALVTVRPEMLRPNKCFSLLASRTTNGRVPAIWISERRPKLGWCWDGNPHNWLGAASAQARLPMP